MKYKVGDIIRWGNGLYQVVKTTLTDYHLKLVSKVNSPNIGRVYKTDIERTERHTKLASKLEKALQ